MILQLQLPPLPSGLAFGLGMLVIGLGLVITWRAYQGSRRNASRPMLLFAVGMLFVTVIPSVVELVVIPLFVARYFSAAAPAIEYALVGSRASEALGIGILLYSLYVRR